jgi:hypothetical protein
MNKQHFKGYLLLKKDKQLYIISTKYNPNSYSNSLVILKNIINNSIIESTYFGVLDKIHAKDALLFSPASNLKILKNLYL